MHEMMEDLLFWENGFVADNLPISTDNDVERLELTKPLNQQSPASDDVSGTPKKTNQIRPQQSLSRAADKSKTSIDSTVDGDPVLKLFHNAREQEEFLKEQEQHENVVVIWNCKSKDSSKEYTDIKENAKEEVEVSQEDIVKLIVDALKEFTVWLAQAKPVKRDGKTIEFRAEKVSSSHNAVRDAIKKDLHLEMNDFLRRKRTEEKVIVIGAGNHLTSDIFVKILERHASEWKYEGQKEAVLQKIVDELVGYTLWIPNYRTMKAVSVGPNNDFAKETMKRSLNTKLKKPGTKQENPSKFNSPTWIREDPASSHIEMSEIMSKQINQHWEKTQNEYQRITDSGTNSDLFYGDDDLADHWKKKLTKKECYIECENTKLRFRCQFEKACLSNAELEPRGVMTLESDSPSFQFVCKIWRAPAHNHPASGQKRKLSLSHKDDRSPENNRRTKKIGDGNGCPPNTTGSNGTIPRGTGGSISGCEFFATHSGESWVEASSLSDKSESIRKASRDEALRVAIHQMCDQIILDLDRMVRDRELEVLVKSDRSGIEDSFDDKPEGIHHAGRMVSLETRNTKASSNTLVSIYEQDSGGLESSEGTMPIVSEKHDEAEATCTMGRRPDPIASTHSFANSDAKGHTSNAVAGSIRALQKRSAFRWDLGGVIFPKVESAPIERMRASLLPYRVVSAPSRRIGMTKDRQGITKEQFKRPPAA